MDGGWEEGGIAIMKRIIAIVVIVGVITVLSVTWYRDRRHSLNATVLVLHGNVDLRQVDLAFNGSQRIAAVLVEEGDRVEAGQVVGYLEMDRLKAAEAQAAAQVQAQTHMVEKLENGTRPEEIDQARANLQSAQSDLTNARLKLERLKRVIVSGGTSEQDVDTARTNVEVAEARLRVNQKTLDLALAGPRKEEIAQAHATLLAYKAQLALIQRELADATLISPNIGIVQNRILEPGEMASPQKPVLSIALTNPKWVRAYVNEVDLGKIRSGMTAAITSDSFQGKQYQGWIGFISPTAEFTPKSVETTELRTSLVYEVRVFVKDPTDELRLGMPTTVTVPLAQNAGTPGKTAEVGRDGA
jgi:HlyD family secretion protein